jgi:hypothetical protein
MKKIIKHYPMTDRLIVTQGYNKLLFLKSITCLYCIINKTYCVVTSWSFFWKYMVNSISYIEENCISSVMVSVLSLSVIDRGFKPRSGQTKDYKNGICCFSAMCAALRRKSKDWLGRNQDNVTEWGDMSIRGLLF